MSWRLPAEWNRTHPASHSNAAVQGGSCAHDACTCVKVAHHNALHYASVAVRAGSGELTLLVGGPRRTSVPQLTLLPEAQGI